MSHTTLFPDLPDGARVWIYGADRSLSRDEQNAIRRVLNAFVEGWTTHGRAVDGRFTILHDRFVLVAAVVPGGDLSGCGIDASVHALETAAQEMDFAWASNLSVFYRTPEGQVTHTSRPAFRKLVRSDQVNADTCVFDLTVDTLGTLRAQGFERPAGMAWHARVFRIEAPTT